jgi:2-polyprenyl-6-methoxyphenol hydroxylase-like FAD-dependent oxidoreductase
MADTPSQTPVLIAGGGPIGLALAADLGRRGVATLLVEERENKLNPAKMLEVSVRTMEFLSEARCGRQSAELGISARLAARQRVCNRSARLRARARAHASAPGSSLSTSQPGAGNAMPADLVRSDPAELCTVVSACEVAVVSSLRASCRTPVA